MKLLGITAEYNPFHNGHAYHIREARRRSGCDSVIVLQSGNFVQRGTPAVMDKYVRAEAALRNGADIVIELPVFSAAASAKITGNRKNRCSISINVITASATITTQITICARSSCSFWRCGFRLPFTVSSFPFV